MNMKMKKSEPAPVDGDGVELVYRQVTLRYEGVELYAERTGEDTWQLRAALNYIQPSEVTWAYEEIFEGDDDAVYAHASGRVKELAELKRQHDAVHDRVRRMSEGER